LRITTPLLTRRSAHPARVLSSLDRTDAIPSPAIAEAAACRPHTNHRIMSSTDISARIDAPSLPTDSPAPDLSWRQADRDVFVATNDGEFAGFVTVDHGTHVTHDNHSRRIGSYPTLAAARQALVDATRPPSRRRERLRRRILARRR
jgi:hypothetical protein